MIPTMYQPAALRSEEYLPWSGGRGVDVWAMILAATSGDLAGMQALRGCGAEVKTNGICRGGL